MARIAGLDLPKDKRIDIALSYIYCVGRPLAKVILANTTINPATRVKNLTEAEVNALNTLISRDLTVEGELRREVSTNIKRLIEIGSYRGVRHRRNLPSRGQRTKTNARTKRGKRKTVGATKAAASQGKPEAKK